MNAVSSALRSAEGRILGLGGGGGSQWRGRRGFGWGEREGEVIRTNTIFTKSETEKAQLLQCSANEAKATS